ncbi:hypothetical protein KAZ01_01740 [Candidatus Gracilibacteria bacterium]|nr:hypothetical protein [Candidatus Gracilibacteria bacterium]
MKKNKIVYENQEGIFLLWYLIEESKYRSQYVSIKGIKLFYVSLEKLDFSGKLKIRESINILGKYMQAGFINSIYFKIFRRGEFILKKDNNILKADLFMLSYYLEKKFNIDEFKTLNDDDNGISVGINLNNNIIKKKILSYQKLWLNDELVGWNKNILKSEVQIKEVTSHLFYLLRDYSSKYLFISSYKTYNGTKIDVLLVLLFLEKIGDIKFIKSECILNKYDDMEFGFRICIKEKFLEDFKKDKFGKSNFDFECLKNSTEKGIKKSQKKSIGSANVRNKNQEEFQEVQAIFGSLDDNKKSNNMNTFKYSATDTNSKTQDTIPLKINYISETKELFINNIKIPLSRLETEFFQILYKYKPINEDLDFGDIAQELDIQYNRLSIEKQKKMKKKYYNANNSLRKKIILQTGIKEIFITSSNLIRFNTKYSYNFSS